MNITELSDVIKNAGIVGAGGAGFPSYAKLNEKADTIILNCAECEPLLRLHRQLLANNAENILTALTEVMKTVGAERGIIALKKTYKKTIEAVEALLPDFPNISIKFLPRVYPAGDEIIAIYEATGRVVEAGKLPISVGVIVYNVETMYNIYNVIKNGRGVTHKHITVNGAVKEPVTLNVPLGITYKEVIALAGGSDIPEYSIVAGGPMTGPVASDTEVVTKTSNALIVLPPDHNVIRRKQVNLNVSLHRAMSACCQCHYCTDLCPRHLLGHPIDPAKLMRAVSNDCTSDPVPYFNTNYCSGCNLCEMFSCFQGLSPKSIITAVKGELKKNGVKGPIPLMRDVEPTRDGKRIATGRLIARLGLTEYNHSAPYVEKEITVNQVKLKLSQGIGAPAEPVVKVGDKVKCGDCIAVPKKDALSVALHASIDGTVSAVNEKYIIIKNGKGTDK